MHARDRLTVGLSIRIASNQQCDTDVKRVVIVVQNAYQCLTSTLESRPLHSMEVRSVSNWSAVQ